MTPEEANATMRVLLPIGAALWVLSSIIAYVLFRTENRMSGRGWSGKDRLIVLLFVIWAGPFFIGVAVLQLAETMMNQATGLNEKLNRPASW